MKPKYIASVSFGKDSLAMLLKILELNLPLDEVVFYDTHMEFSAIYKIRDKIRILLENNNNNIKFTILESKNSFLYTMLEKPVKKRDGTTGKGYSWCGGRCRWGTTEKLKYIEKYCKNAYQYVGIAYDEPTRVKNNPYKIYPLVDLKMTEADCLRYCKEQGFNWIEDGIDLYSILDRVSCWCCANKNLKELKNYYKYLPKYWERLKWLQTNTDRPMKYNKYSVFDLEEKFKNEEKNT